MRVLMIGDVDGRPGRSAAVGARPEDALHRFLTQTPQRLRVATAGPVEFNSALIQIDDATGRATSIERVDRELG